jgi:hypothetical protein
MKFDAAQPPLANDDRCYTQGFSEAAFSPAMRPKAIASGMLLPPGYRKPKNERKNFLPQISPVLFRGSTPSNPHPVGRLCDCLHLLDVAASAEVRWRK